MVGLWLEVKILVDISISTADFSLKNVRFPCFFKQAFFIANTKGRHALVT
ncbi:hypothetical protein [Moraxella lacunata]